MSGDRRKKTNWSPVSEPPQSASSAPVPGTAGLRRPGHWRGSPNRPRSGSDDRKVRGGESVSAPASWRYMGHGDDSGPTSTIEDLTPVKTIPTTSTKPLRGNASTSAIGRSRTAAKDRYGRTVGSGRHAARRHLDPRQEPKHSSRRHQPIAIPGSRERRSAWPTMVKNWFQEADADDDGRVTGDEAVGFFRRTGLDDDDLAKIWDLTVPPKEEGMDHRQFESALKLVALLQAGDEFTNQNIQQAIARPYPLMPPSIGPMEIAAGSPTSLSSSPSTPRSPTGSDGPHGSGGIPAAPPWLVSKLNAAVPDIPVQSNQPSEDMRFPQMNSSGVGEETNGDPADEEFATHTFRSSSTCLVNVELRLPPLKPKDSAKLKKIAAINGSLMGFPSLSGGLLQWTGVHESLDELGNTQRELGEDADSMPCIEIQSEKETRITSYSVDATGGFLWLGHENGFVNLWVVGDKSQRLSAHITSWRAHKYGSVSAMAVSHWGALWTGSSKGSLRVWEHATSGCMPGE